MDTLNSDLINVQKSFQPSMLAGSQLADASVAELKGTALPHVIPQLMRIKGYMQDSAAETVIGALERVSQFTTVEKIRESEDLPQYVKRLATLAADVIVASAPEQASRLARMDSTGIMKAYAVAKEANPAIEEGLKVVRSRIANAVQDAVGEKATHLKADRMAPERANLATSYMNDAVAEALQLLKDKAQTQGMLQRV